MDKSKFRKDIETAINMNCAENGSDTPDFILAEYLMNCLDNFDKTILARSKWYNHHCSIGKCNHNEHIILCDHCQKPTTNSSHPASGIILCDKCDGKEVKAEVKTGLCLICSKKPHTSDPYWCDECKNKMQKEQDRVHQVHACYPKGE